MDHRKRPPGWLMNLPQEKVLAVAPDAAAFQWRVTFPLGTGDSSVVIGQVPYNGNWLCEGHTGGDGGPVGAIRLALKRVSRDYVDQLDDREVTIRQEVQLAKDYAAAVQLLSVLLEAAVNHYG